MFKKHNTKINCFNKVFILFNFLAVFSILDNTKSIRSLNASMSKILADYLNLYVRKNCISLIYNLGVSQNKLINKSS